MTRPEKRPCDPSARPLPHGLLGQRVAVAYHFHNHCYTIAIGGKVQGYTRAVVLLDVTARVQRGGYERCRKERTRNVHAWLLGELAAEGEALASMGPPEGSRRLTYHCKQGPPCFYYADDGDCLVSAHELTALPSGVWVVNATSPFAAAAAAVVLP